MMRSFLKVIYYAFDAESAGEKKIKICQRLGKLLAQVECFFFTNGV